MACVARAGGIEVPAGFDGGTALPGAVAADRATSRRHAGMAKGCGCPGGRAVTGIARQCCLQMPAGFDGSATLTGAVATDRATARRDAGMAKRCRCPSGGAMAGVAR